MRLIGWLMSCLVRWFHPAADDHDILDPADEAIFQRLSELKEIIESAWHARKALGTSALLINIITVSIAEWHSLVDERCPELVELLDDYECELLKPVVPVKRESKARDTGLVASDDRDRIRASRAYGSQTAGPPRPKMPIGPWLEPEAAAKPNSWGPERPREYALNTENFPARIFANGDARARARLRELDRLAADYFGREIGDTTNLSFDDCTAIWRDAAQSRR